MSAMAETARSPRVAGCAAAIVDIRCGRFVVILDAEDRPRLVIAAQFVTPAAMARVKRWAATDFCLCFGSGRPSAPLLNRMTADELARRVQEAIRGGDGDLPTVVARSGGVLEHAGPAEAAVDLARLAGLLPATALAAVPAAPRGLRRLRIGDVRAHRLRTETSLRVAVDSRLPTAFGTFRAVALEEMPTGRHHVVLVRGDVAGRADVRVAVHRRCLLGHVLRARACACREELEASLRELGECERGVLVYLAGDVGFDCAAPDDPETVGRVLAELGVS